MISPEERFSSHDSNKALKASVSSLGLFNANPKSRAVFRSFNSGAASEAQSDAAFQSSFTLLDKLGEGIFDIVCKHITVYILMQDAR